MTFGFSFMQKPESQYHYKTLLVMPHIITRDCWRSEQTRQENLHVESGKVGVRKERELEYLVDKKGPVMLPFLRVKLSDFDDVDVDD